MEPLVIFDNGNHKNILLADYSAGLAIQANQHIIVHDASGMLLDPGGHKVYSQVFAETHRILKEARLEHLFLSHQDPDIVAALNGWLMTTDARAYAPNLWLRFIPHFGLDHLLEDRLIGIADEGGVIEVGDCKLLAVPAHWLHSCGNLQLYDPIARILYTGDLGASVGQTYREVDNFDDHLQYMLGFHQRYMGSNAAMRAWSNMARQLDIDVIAPQHGALFRGKEMVNRFIDWCAALQCGVDLIPEYKLPQQ